MTDKVIKPEKPAHLGRLPPKNLSKPPRPGDIVGGMVYVGDKPSGIEEGMVGISVDSVPYRAYIEQQIKALLEGNHLNKDLQERFKAKILVLGAGAGAENRENLITEMMRDSVDGPVNTGMGGLLFSAYKTDICKINEKDHFSVVNRKLIEANTDTQKAADEVYMIKQDGELFLGGTGPSLNRILNTTVGKKLSTLLEPKWYVPTLGLSAVAFVVVATAWKGYYLWTNNPVKANSDAIRETIATKMTGLILGSDTTQEMDTVEGTYPNGKPKVVMSVKWTKGLGAFHLEGGGKNPESVAVSTNAGFPIKTSLDRKFIYQYEKETTSDGAEKLKIFKIDTANNNKVEADKKTYDAAFSVSDDKIYGMGQALINYVRLGDTDTVGSKGQNKGTVPMEDNPPYTRRLYGIDFGKAYQGENPIVKKLNDDFSFIKPNKKDTYKNYSMLYDNPLTDKMQGVYLLAAMRGQLTDTSTPKKSEIAAEYATLDPIFAKKLTDCPAPNPGKINGDIDRLDEEIRNYFKLAVEAKNSKDKNIQKKSEHYTSYAKELIEVKMIAEATDTSILNTFESRLKLMPSQINLLDNIEKLTAKKAHTLSPDGKVLLNHIRVDRKDRIPWQIEVKANGDYRLYCQAKPEDFKGALDKLKAYSDPDNKINIIIGKIEIKDAKAPRINNPCNFSKPCYHTYHEEHGRYKNFQEKI